MNLFYKIAVKLLRMAEQEKARGIQKQFKFCGSNIKIDPTCYILVPQQLEVGDNTSISAYTTLYAAFGIKIGKNCLISSNCGISSYNHISESLNRQEQAKEDIRFSKPVLIGDNVWIGMNACILPGVSVGNNSIIGSGSVVTKNVPPNEVWVGNPACLKKRLFT